MVRVLLGLLLLGCSSPAPAAATPAAVEDTGIAEEGAAPPTLTWSACDTFECASLAVESGVELSVIRRRATADRLGVLLFNPGGPGNAAVSDLPRLARTFDTLFGAAVMARFDLIAVDFRGIGKSTPALRCGDRATLDALFDADIAPTRPNPPELDAPVKALAKACAAIDLAVDSVTAARDIDTLRIALGEEKISFLGISYGTWIGATYAARYPTHVRSFVLDSCLAPHKDQRDNLRDWARGTEAALTDFFSWCESTGKCGLKTVMKTATASEAFDALMTRLDAAPIAVGARRLTRLRALFATRSLLGEPAYARLDRFLSEAAEGNAGNLLSISDMSNGRTSSGYDGVFMTRIAIRVSDRPYPEGFTGDQYVAFRRDLALEHPRAGFAAAAFDIIALEWGLRRAPLSNVATTAPPMLLLAGKHDPATIFDQTTRLQTALGNGSFVVASQGYGHAQIYRSPCVAKAAAAFFVDPIAPAVTECEGSDP
jgi:pimeloyl-ACP methyl ester carboxylesterase